jgi:hypothetical protein
VSREIERWFGAELFVLELGASRAPRGELL